MTNIKKPILGSYFDDEDWFEAITTRFPILLEYHENTIQVIIKGIRKPGFRINHVKKMDSSISYRRINGWESSGITCSSRELSNRSWRQFSILDIVTILIVVDLRAFGFARSKIKAVISKVKECDDSVYGGSSILELVILSALFGNVFQLVVFSNGSSIMLQNEELHSEFGLKVLATEKHIMLPVSQYVIRLFNSLGFNLKLKNLYAALNPQYDKLVRLIENEDISEIRIFKNRNRITKAKTIRIVNGKFSIEDLNKILNRSDFQKIDVIQKDGSIVALKSEESVRL